MATSSYLGGQSGVQYNGIETDEGGYPKFNLQNALLVGEFKRGPFHKPFKVTKETMEAQLSYDYNNPYYVALEDAFKTGAEYVWVMRTGEQIVAPEPEPEPQWSAWQLLQGVVIKNNIATYQGFKTKADLTLESYAEIDLAAAITASLSDPDMQQWQAVKDAANELTGVTNWVIDPGNSQIVYTKPSDLNDPQDPEYGKYLYSMGFGEFPSPNKACQSFTTVQNIGFISANYDQCVTRQSLWGVMSDYAYAWSSRRINPAYIPPSNGSLNGERLLTFAAIAQKIISNASSSDQGISLLAEAYIEAVANSIFNADESKQFVKLADLIQIFEANKTQR